MENSADKKPFPGHIATWMKPEQIRALTEKAFEEVPNAAGVNNHEGSRFTASKKSMRVFLELVKKKGLFFVDSRTISNSVAYDLAREMEVPAATRDVFLDHNGDPDVIRKQFKLLFELAKEHGSALGICHFRPRTAKLLGEILPTLKENEVELVHVSELVE